MGETTGITWTDHTFNPWMGCAKISPGCTNCYAERDAARWKLAKWGASEPRKRTSTAYWKQPATWNRKNEALGVRTKVFCASFADVFEDHRDLPPWRAALWPIIEATPFLDWLILTKRPENVVDMVPQKWLLDGFPPNYWPGITVEDQEATKRIPFLQKWKGGGPRWISAEPLLEPLRLDEFLEVPCNCLIPALEGAGQHSPACSIFKGPAFDWIIVGGESGPSTQAVRPFSIEWARDILAQVRTWGKDRARRPAFFLKQLGQAAGEGFKTLATFPEDLQVQEFPTERIAR